MNILNTVLFIACFCFLPAAHAVPISRIYGQRPDPQFLNGYVDRFYKWSAQVSSNIEAPWTMTEKKLFPLWKSSLTEWGLSLSASQSFEHFLITYTVVDGFVQKPSYFLGLPRWPSLSHDLLIHIARERGFQLTPQLLPHLHGFQWNQHDNSFELHFLLDKASEMAALPPEIRTLSGSLPDSQWLYPRKWIVTVDKDKKQRAHKLLAALSAVDWKAVGKPLQMDILALQKTIDTSGATEWRMDLRSLPPTALGPATKDLADGWSKEFSLYPDSLTYSSFNTYKLYYP